MTLSRLPSDRRICSIEVAANRSTRTVAVGVLVLAGIVSGCTTNREVTRQSEIIGNQIGVIDSLRAMNRALSAEIGILQDSLQFVDDIETGKVYREMRALEDRIKYLEFLLHQRDEGVTVATLPADELFAPATADLSESGRRRLDGAIELFMERFDGHLLRIEGHADAAPLGPALTERYGGNWGLSAARAASVLSYLLENHALDEQRVSAVAFGDTRPVASNDSADGRRQNRRVRIVAVPPGDGAGHATTDVAR